MGSLLFLYFLHPITTRLANKTHWLNPRYDLTNPTKNPPPPFAFSLLSTFLLHLHYTLQPPSTLFPIPFSLCYYPPSSCYPVSSYPVPPLLILCYYPLFSCYPVSSSHVTTPCSFVTLSSLTLSLLSSSSVTTALFLCYSVSSSPVTILCSFVTLSPFTLSPYTLSCKECLPVLSTGAFTLSKKRPLKHAEHALLAPWRRPSCPLNMPFLEARVQVFDSKEVTIVKETDMMSLSKWFG